MPTALRVIAWLIRGGEILFALNVVALIAAVIAKRLREPVAGLLFLSTWFWAVTLTVWCAVVVYAGWGWFWTAFGLLLGVIGIVPVALVCLVLKRDWMNLAELVFQTALVIGAWILATRIAPKE